MAFLRDIKIKCDGYQIQCDRRAVKELVDRWNGLRGQFCSRCAPKALKKQNERESPEPSAGK